MYRQVDENIWKMYSATETEFNQNNQEYAYTKANTLHFIFVRQIWPCGTLLLAASGPPARAPRHITRINQIATIYSGEDIFEKTF